LIEITKVLGDFVGGWIMDDGWMDESGGSTLSFQQINLLKYMSCLDQNEEDFMLDEY
jgi:hypothetical protein